MRLDTKNQELALKLKSMQDEVRTQKGKIEQTQELLHLRGDESLKSSNNLQSVKNEINGIKLDIKNIDNEICYYEDQNRKHAQAQSQLQKALEYEICRGKEYAVNDADVKVRLKARQTQAN